VPHLLVRDDVRRRLTVTVSGPLTIDVVFSIVDHQAADGTWAYGVLHDLSGTTGAVDASAIRMLVDRVKRLSVVHGPRGPVALVTSEPAQFGMGRMYGILGEMGEASPVGVFRDIEAAGRWLDELQSPQP
jgi:hypothetical protein